MSFGWGVGDIIAISKLAAKVYTAYKDAPSDYKNIAEEVRSLEGIINKAAQHFRSAALSDNDLQVGQEALKGCQSVLRDLNSLIEKYGSLASTNTGQVFQRVKLGTEDIATLRARLTSNATLLSSFIRSCEYLEIQARLNDILGLHSTNSRVSIDSITSFAGSINTKKAYKKFCKGLYQVGVTSEMISEKEKEIFDIFKSQDIATTSWIDNSAIENQSQSLVSNRNRARFGWVRPLMDSLVGPLMLAAAEAGNIRRLISTLGYIQNIDFEDDQKETALHKAAYSGHMDAVQLLLGRGASIGARNRYHNTPLHLAIQNGHTSLVGLLLEKGAPIEAVSSFNNTPLHVAAWSGHTGAVELLLERGASVEAITWFGDTPLHLAARNGSASIVESLLNKGSPIDARNAYDNTPLNLAARNGRSSTVELLLGRGAPIGAMNRVKDTPLHAAASDGHTSTVELLLRKGASIEAMNKSNCTPLHLAAEGGHADIVQLLNNKAAKLVGHGNRA